MIHQTQSPVTTPAFSKECPMKEQAAGRACVQGSAALVQIRQQRKWWTVIGFRMEVKLTLIFPSALLKSISFSDHFSNLSKLPWIMVQSFKLLVVYASFVTHILNECPLSQTSLEHINHIISYLSDLLCWSFSRINSIVYSRKNSWSLLIHKFKAWH